MPSSATCWNTFRMMRWACVHHSVVTNYAHTFAVAQSPRGMLDCHALHMQPNNISRSLAAVDLSSERLVADVLSSAVKPAAAGPGSAASSVPLSLNADARHTTSSYMARAGGSLLFQPRVLGVVSRNANRQSPQSGSCHLAGHSVWSCMLCRYDPRQLCAL